MLIKYFLPLFLILFLTGCINDPEIKFSKPKVQTPKQQPIIRRNKGSLYAVKGASLFADKRDLQVGDIIRIEVDESLSSDTDNSRETASDRNSSLGAGIFASTSTTGTASKIVNKLNPLTGLSFDSSSSSDNSGDVDTSLNESFSTTVSAIIEETYQNGNYYVKGEKELLIDGQKQSLIISGVIRPYDITSDNTVTSSQVANLKILYKKEGEEQDVMHTPWALRIIQMFWPF